MAVCQVLEEGSHENLNLLIPGTAVRFSTAEGIVTVTSCTITVQNIQIKY